MSVIFIKKIKCIINKYNGRHAATWGQYANRREKQCYNSYIPKNKILAITGIDAAPLKRLRQNAEDMNKLIDCTKGRRALSLIHLVDGFVVSSANSTEKLFERMGE